MRAVAITTLLLTLCCVARVRAEDQWHDSHDQCEMCHSEHFSQSHTWSGAGAVSPTPQPNGDWLGTTGPNPRLLKSSTANDELCIACHQGPPPTPSRAISTSSLTQRTFTSVSAWNRSPHAALRCANCHNPHGVTDAQGLVPARLRAREPQLCLTCHDNPQRGDIAMQLMRSYVHGAAAQNQRRVTCSDCHNSHEGNQDPAPPELHDASSRLAAVSRIEVLNGGAGVVPSYRWLGADEPGLVLEYQICFKCHSSWQGTTRPQGQPDLALLTNPANASYHPIQAPGRSPNIDPASFVNGYAADSLLLCSDCHSSDDTRSRGPHGSSNPYLLKKPARTSTLPEAARPDDLCFECHAFATYADPAAPEAAVLASRFNGPATSGHTIHTGVHRISCRSCHETHGSVSNPSLIATRRGITSYLQTSTGGTCNTTCHAIRTYEGNYPR